MRLTKSQEKAIYTLNKNIILYAGAGTGKTEVLTRRFVEMIRSGIPLESIVCITFTKKAAKEMQERIREILIEEGFLKELDSFYKANISTIDSFCKNIVSEYARFCQVNPNFKILDEIEEEALLEQILRDRLPNNPDILEIFYQYLGFFTEEEVFKEILSFIISKKDILNLSEIRKKNEKIFNDFSEEEVHKKLREELLYISDILKNNKSSALAKFLKDENIEYLNNREILSEEFLEKIRQFNYSIVPLKKVGKDEIVLDLLMELDLINDIKNKKSYDRFFDFLEEVLVEYQKEKEESGYLDFSDLSNYTLKLLKNPEVKKRLVKKYTHFLIDEYQDCSTIQKNLFFNFCSEEKPLDKNNFFAVGDPKQSIYAFRGARAHIFKETVKNVLESNGELIYLEDNFRSTNEILDPINYLFDFLMDERYEHQKAHRSSVNSDFFVSRDSETPETVQAVDFIKYKMEEGQSLGDFTYLFRNRNSLEEYQEILREEEISHYIVNSQGFFKDPLVSDLVNFMIYSIFPEKRYLIAILKGMFYNISDEELYEIFVLKKEDYIEEIDLKSREYLKRFNESIYNGLTMLIYEYEIIEKANANFKSFQSHANLYKLLLMALQEDLSDGSFYDFVLKIMEENREEEDMQLEDEDSDIVKLMTIHQSKGLSLDSVIIPKLNQRTRPNRNRINFHEEVGLSLSVKNSGLEKMVKEYISLEEEEQMENLYYVAMTRAKNNLFLGCDGINSGFKGKIKEPLQEELESGEISVFPEVSLTIDNKERRIQPIEKILSFDRNFKRKKKMNYNIHMVSEFFDDREKYMKNYLEIFQEREEKTSPSVIGQFVHYFAENYDGSFEEAFKKAEDQFPLFKEDVEEVKTYCENFISLNPLKENILKETPFHLLYEGLPFAGIIDRLEFSENKIRIIDFKISNLGDSLVEFYRLQLLFYGYAVKKNYPEFEIDLILQNLKNNREYSIIYDEDFLHSQMAEFIEFTSELE